LIDTNRLTDPDLARFVEDGHLVVRTTLPREFHANLYSKIDDVFDKEGNPGNNILPRVPEIAKVYDDPAVRAALGRLLGPDFVMNPHRATHLNPPGSKGQSWHKDCYVYDHNLRHPRFRWVMAFYYPQDVTSDMGPTGVMPGQQWFQDISDPDPSKATEEAEPLIGEAGTVSIVHFDCWHRAMANMSDSKRYMLKFQFARTREPETSEPGQVEPATAAWQQESAVCNDVWSWLHGTTPKPASNGQPVGSLVEDLQSPERQTRRKAADALAGCGAAGDAVEPLEAALNDVDESVRLHAAYALATAGDSGVKTLIQHLRDDAMAAEERALAKTADNAHGTNPTAQVAAQALGVAPGAIGPLAALLTDEHWLVRASAADALGNRPIEAEQVMEELVTAADDDHWWVRRNAIEALGRSRKMTDRARVKVSACLRDEDYRVRRNAAMAMRQSPEAVADTIYGLAGMLSDENRYNRFYAVDALRQLAPADDAAQTLLIDYLFTARWCALTNSESAF
jgi:HEAT repeat protein